MSPLCLGSMSLGDQWTGYMGGKSVDQKHSEELLDAFVQAGGQFIDTACNYQCESSFQRSKHCGMLQAHNGDWEQSNKRST